MSLKKVQKEMIVKREEIWAHVGRVRPEQEREGKKSGKWWKVYEFLSFEHLRKYLDTGNFECNSFCVAYIYTNCISLPKRSEAWCSWRKKRFLRKPNLFLTEQSSGSALLPGAEFTCRGADWVFYKTLMTNISLFKRHFIIYLLNLAFQYLIY